VLFEHVMGKEQKEDVLPFHARICAIRTENSVFQLSGNSLPGKIKDR